MDENAFGYEDDPEQPEHHAEQPEHHPGQPEHYWHRRAAILVAGLGLISLLAWALSPSGGKSAGAAARASQPSAALSAAADSGNPDPSAETSPDASAAVPGLTSPGTGSASPGTGSARSATAGASPGTARPGGAKASEGTGRASSGSAASPGTGSGQLCSPSAVVLSLFSKSSYPDGRDLGFAVDAVSTAPGTCTFDLGPGQMQLVVMSAGRIIWDSGDCPRGSGAQPALLSRGVPVQETITWNRAVTLPGCVILASSAPPGTYEVQAKEGTVASSVRSFRLAR